MSIHIQLERFEGPLGLLLFLIRKEEMDVFDINIHHITRQYLEYIRNMRRLDLEVAGEFVAMAATLIHIKSRMLLPQYTAEGEEILAEDPRKELVQKLLEYQKFQDAAKGLYERPLLGRDLFARGSRFRFDENESDEVIVEENPLFALISSYRAALRAMKSGVHKVVAPLQSIAARIMELKDRLMLGQRVRFSELIDVVENRSGQVLVTFLSLLELGKMGFVSLFQSEPYSDIHIEARRAIDGDVVVRAESYDNQASEKIAEQLLLDAELSEPDEGVLVTAAETLQSEANPLEEMATDEDILEEERRLNLMEEEIVQHQEHLPDVIGPDAGLEPSEV